MSLEGVQEKVKNMGLDYSLKLAADMRPEQVLRLMAEALGLKWSDERHLGGPAIWIGAGEISELGRSLIEEGFRFTPSLSILFRLNTNSPDYEEGNRIMVRAALLLLQPGREGVLLFNGEIIVMQRLKGQLVLNEDFGGWTDGLCLEAEVGLPHEKRSLPSPLL
jgi:hypothetical protein